MRRHILPLSQVRALSVSRCISRGGIDVFSVPSAYIRARISLLVAQISRGIKVGRVLAVTIFRIYERCFPPRSRLTIISVLLLLRFLSLGLELVCKKQRFISLFPRDFRFQIEKRTETNPSIRNFCRFFPSAFFLSSFFLFFCKICCHRYRIYFEPL